MDHTDRLFVRCHTYAPKVDLNEWSLKIDGVVEQPMADLKKLPRVELVHYGGEGGIRNLKGSTASASYRFSVAASADVAIVPRAPCPILPDRPMAGGCFFRKA